MAPRAGGPVVGCVSLEPWDDVWRRNQHLASRLVRLGHARRVVFVEPPVPGRGLGRRDVGAAGVDVVRPSLLAPKRLGGLRLAARWLRSGALAGVDVLWVNDPTLGVHCLMPGVPVVYDVTDDWRTFQTAARVTTRVVAAEDRLSRRAHTVVCSDELARRWLDRYGVTPAIVPNGVDVDAVRRATARPLVGTPPHVGYVGTVHPQRVDLDLVLELAERLGGTVHLIGPLDLPTELQLRLARTQGIRLEGAARAADVPSWMTAMDVLVCPHLVSDFTLSLDAIKAHEYLATRRPVVATPTSGFQALGAPGLRVAGRAEFVDAVLEALSDEPVERHVVDWDLRAHAFARELRTAAA